MEVYTGKITSPFNKNRQIEFSQLYLDDNVIEVEFSSSSREFQSIKIIYGIFNKLGQVALVNCKISSVSSGAAADLKKYTADYCFAGEFDSDPSLIDYQKLRVELPELLNWTQISTVDNKLFFDKKLSILPLIKENIHSSKDLEISFISNSNIRSERKNNKITITESLTMEIISQSDKDFLGYLKLLREIQKLIIITSNHETKTDKVVLFHEDEPIELYIRSSILFNGNYSTNVIKLDYNKVKADFNTIISNWVSNNELNSSIDLILEKSINSKLSRENYFLNNCFALETFHRRFHNYSIFSKEKFKEVKKNILDSIKDDNLKDWISNNLAHINQPNFRLRLNDMLEQFELVLTDEEIDSQYYIKRIVKTRNYLVHRSSTDHIFNSFDLLYAAIRLENIVRANILISIGVKKEIVYEALENIGRGLSRLYENNHRNNSYT